MRLPEDQPEPLAAQPWQDLIRLIETGRQQHRVVGALLKPRTVAQDMQCNLDARRLYG
jgi:hypothetical protein